MQQGPLPPVTVGFISICWLAQRDVDYPAAPAQPPRQLHVMLLSPKPTQTTPAPQLGELRGVGKVPWGLRGKWAGSLLASDAEMGRAGCLLPGGRSSESIKGITATALQRQQSRMARLAFSLRAASVVLRLPLATWGFFTKSGVFRLKTLLAGTLSFCVWVVIGVGRTLSRSIDEYLYSHSQKYPAVALCDKAQIELRGFSLLLFRVSVCGFF